MNLYRASARGVLSSSISRALRPRSDQQPFTWILSSSGRSLNPLSQNTQNTFSGCPENITSKAGRNESIGLSILGNLRRKLASMKAMENLHLPSAFTFQRFIHSGNPEKAEMGANSRPMDFVRGIIEESGTNAFGRSQLSQYTVEQNGGHSGNPEKAEMGGNSRPMDFVRGIIEESGTNAFGRSQLSQYALEQNADVVHMKLLRNNTFITLTDSKGNRKPGERVSASAGSLPDKGGKVSRYGAEATAEHVGREARKSGVKSVVVKVNGFTYFKKKRQAIMAFKEGYTHGRGDQTPIVYIEDTTRRPHNGCRRPKKRRI
ncbi:hypothetical protein ACH5RR_036595 [Cinchona calisaya]|uniref:Ribosomal protein S11 n=1 Tax=Cinchona calisaya TaxID=153742 RepID=A0ABD2Y3N3_9GENT